MSNVKQAVGTRTALTSASLSTLATATYCVSNTIDSTTNQPLDVLVEVSITPGTTSGNKYAVVFSKASLDNTNWQSGPETGTTTTDESNLTFLGTLPLGTSSGAQRGVFSLASAYRGVLPPYVKIVIKNDSGATFTAGTIFTSEVAGLVV